MDYFQYSEQYALLADDQLLRLWAERTTLVPEAAVALECEVRNRGLKTQNAERVKRRLDALAAREGPLGPQVAAAKYKRNMRHFIGWQEPEFHSPYSGRDIRSTFAFFRHKHTV